MTSAAPSAPPVLDADRASRPPARSLWMVTLEYDYGWNHGGHLRIFAITREWVRRGAEVHFVALDTGATPPERAREYLEQLRRDGIITSFDQIRQQHPRVRGKFARAALLPAAQNLILRRERGALVAELDRIAEAFRPDVIVYGARQLLWAVPALRRHAPVVVDWGDFYGLYFRRLLATAIGRKDPRLTLESLWGLMETLPLERSVSRAADANIYVSPVDAAAVSSFAAPRAGARVVANGIREGSAAPNAPRPAGRLIFTGNMAFPPNHYSAVWFIERVLPLIVARRPDVEFVVAGSNPRRELQTLSSRHVRVTGYVDDMRAELAACSLYVAPLIAGSGFKNKVLEALASGLNVVGTTLAFEFLEPRLQALFRPVDEPRGLADAVLAALSDPSGNAATVERFWALAGNDFEWEHVAGRFAGAVAHLRVS